MGFLGKLILTYRHMEVFLDFLLLFLPFFVLFLVFKFWLL